MPNFMIAYYGGSQPKTKEEGMAQMEKWRTWIKNLGDKIVNPGTPLPISKLVTSENVTTDENPDSMRGFAVVHADDIDGAVRIAKTDPFLESGGTIRVSHMTEM